MDWHKLKLDKLDGLKVLPTPEGVEHGLTSTETDFDGIVVFAQSQEQLNHAIELIRSENRPLTLVVAFPKKTSKRFKSEINRDDIAHSLMDGGEFGGPFLVSLDSDWSGFKFRYPV